MSARRWTSGDAALTACANLCGLARLSCWQNEVASDGQGQPPPPRSFDLDLDAIARLRLLAP